MNKNNKETSKNKPEELCKAITFKEQNKILKTLGDEKYGYFFYFCCCTGVRICEALNIKHKDINLDKSVINITLKDSKTKKHKRQVPILPELFDGIKLYKTSKKLLFDSITDEASSKYFSRLYTSLNMDLCRHSTRHTFVSIATIVGIEPNIIKEWVGHTDVNITTQTYTHALSKGTSPIFTYIKKLKKHPLNNKKNYKISKAEG